MSLIVALLDRFLSGLILFMARREVEKIKPIISDAIDKHMASFDIEALKKSLTEKAKSDALKRIAHDSFGPPDSKL